MTELTPDTPNSDDHPSPGIRLTGWKEIATYLDKAVRTVQRWERDFGLPVRRVSDDRVSSVYAYSVDLDDWLRSPSGERARGQQTAESDETPPVAPGGPGVPPRGRPQMLAITWVLAAAVLVLAGGWAWQTWRPGLPSKPATWNVEGDTLTVFDNAGDVVFRYSFGMPLNGSAYAQGALHSDKLAGTDDIDGDGQYEFWFVAAPARPTAEHVKEAFLFDNDGHVRWRYRYSGSATFGSERFDSLWSPRFLFATDRPEGGPGRAFWAVSTERTAFPSVLQRLDVRTGRSMSTYWSNGYIESVALGRFDGRRALLVGGAFNDGKCASLAVLDAMNPNGSAPAVRDKYRCGDCPPGSPLAFVLFPKPARFAPLGTNGGVVAIDATNAHDVVVNVGHALAADEYATVVYRLDRSLRPTWLDTADGYLRTYETLVRQGLLPPGGPAAMDPATEFPPPLYWKGGSTFEAGSNPVR